MSPEPMKRVELESMGHEPFEALAETCRQCDGARLDQVELLVGDLLEVPGRDPEAVVWVRSGHVELRVERGEVWRQVVGDVGPGGVVGLAAVVLGHPSTHTAEVKQPGLALRIPRAAMLAVLREQGGMFRSLLRSLLERSATQERAIAELALLSLEQRVVRALLQLADGEIVRMSHEELAARVGGSREEVTRVLSRLRRRDLIVTGRRRVTLGRRAELERLAVSLPGLD